MKYDYAHIVPSDQIGYGADAFFELSHHTGIADNGTILRMNETLTRQHLSLSDSINVIQ